MAGCNCKTNGETNNVTPNKNVDNVIEIILKISSFILGLVLLPIINVALIWFLFRTLVLNKNVNIKPILVLLGKKFGDKEETTPIDNLTEDDVIENTIK